MQASAREPCNNSTSLQMSLNGKSWSNKAIPAVLKGLCTLATHPQDLDITMNKQVDIGPAGARQGLAIGHGGHRCDRHVWP